jgi:Flp pilus assembly pilin Flp
MHPEPPKEHSMLKVLASMQNFLAEPVRRNDRGITATEYALLLAFVAVALIATLKAFTTALNGVFTGVEGFFP